MESIRNFTSNRFALFFSVFVVFQPIIDIFTSLCTRAEISVTPGIVLRTILMAYAFFYIVFVSRFKERKICLWYIVAITVYIMIFLVYMYKLGGFNCLIGNFKETIKTFFFPYVSIFLYSLYREYGFTTSQKAIAIAGLIYTGVIFVAYVTGTSFVTYNSGYGYSGWFFAANEISDIIALIAPVSLFTIVGYLKTPDENRWKTGILVGFGIFTCGFASNYIGTKVVFIFVFIYLLACTIWYFVSYKNNCDKSLRIRAWFCFFGCLFVLLLFSSGSLFSYLSNVFLPMKDEKSEEAIVSINKEILAAAQGTWLYNLIESNSFFKTVNWILSKRLLIIAPSAQEFTDGGFLTKLIGIGYKNTSINTHNIERLIEMDAPALLIRHGLMGFILGYIPYLATVIFIIIKFCKKFKSSMSNLECCTYFYCTLVGFAISCFVGHGLNAPAVSFYLSILIMNMLMAFQKRDKALMEGK